MKLIHGLAIAMFLVCSLTSRAQQTVATNTNVVVPPLVNFSGTLTDVNGKPLTGVVGVTFLLYQDAEGGSPLWLETQNVRPDSRGHYTVMLGSTRSEGLPSDIFVAGEAHWLGVQVQGEDEHPRVMLVAVPYALKAGDAQTLGGLPASAFALATPSGTTGVSGNELPAAVATATAATIPPPASVDVTTTGGSVATLPLFATATSIQNSIVTQTGTTAINVGGKLNLFATGAATAAGGKNSQPFNMSASAFNSGTQAAVNQAFQWLAEAAGNDTASPSGALHLLSDTGAVAPTETGLSIASNGQITFAPGQTFSATNSASSFGVAMTGTTTGSGIGDYGVEGIATATSGLATGVYGSGASPSGFGVVGNSSLNVGVLGETDGSTSTSYGVEGYVNSLVGTGVGVYGSSGVNPSAIGVEGVSFTVGVLGNGSGTGSYGVEGVSSNVGVLGSASGSGYGVEGKSPYLGVFGNATGGGGIGVDGQGAFVGVYGVATATGGYSGVFGEGPVWVSGNGNATLIGDAGCGSGYAGIGFTNGSLSNCKNYALLGDTKGNTYINSSGATGIHFRNNNNNLVTIDASGDLTVTGKVHSGNVAASVTASNQANASIADCTSPLSAPNSNCLTPGMSLKVTTSGGPILVIANIGMVVPASCVLANFHLVMDNEFIGGAVVALAPVVGAYAATPLTMTSLQTPAAGTHTFQVQETDDTSFLCSNIYVQTTVSGQSAFVSETAPRSLIVREF
jgi:hypothetical protein